jgi:thiamine transport system substrate-binding protein
MKKFAVPASIAALALIAMLPAYAGQELVVYAYDSFVSWGLAEATMHKFEAAHQCTITLIATGDAGQVLNRVILEKDNPQADVVVGIDNTYLAKALQHDVLVPYKPANIDLVPPELILDPSFHLTPFEYGFIAFVYDSKKISAPPASLRALTDPAWKEKIILQDPRTSSPGMALLLWSIAVFGEDGYLDFWEQVQPSILTITKGWDTAYGMFTAGEAPLVLSYATSPAYHVEVEQSTRYLAAPMTEGFYRQIEGMGIVKGARNLELAQHFIEWMLTEEFQQEIPLTQWVFPVNPNVALPASFDYAAKTDTFLTLDPALIAERYDAWLAAWTALMTQ